MRRILTLCAVAAIAAAAAVPSFGSDSGSIPASVVPATPCITIGTRAIDFGTLPFSPASTTNPTTANATSSYTNCSSAENVYFSGTDATSATSSAVWTLESTGSGGAATCGFGPNVYKLGLGLAGAGGTFSVFKTAQLLESTPAGTTRNLNLALFMPCEGSSGAGERMSFQYLLTATF
jgi:hypothetical protein